MSKANRKKNKNAVLRSSERRADFNEAGLLDRHPAEDHRFIVVKIIYAGGSDQNGCQFRPLAGRAERIPDLAGSDQFVVRSRPRQHA